MWEFGGVSPLILNLDTKWGLAVILLSGSCTLCRKGSPLLINRRFSGLYSLYGRFGVEMDRLPRPEIESRFPGYVPRSLIVNDNTIQPPSAQGCVTVPSYLGLRDLLFYIPTDQTLHLTPHLSFLVTDTTVPWKKNFFLSLWEELWAFKSAYYPTWNKDPSKRISKQ